jgi:hypothetical protein
VLSWQVLTADKPYLDMRNENMLASHVRRGHRPDLRQIPTDCPESVINMIMTAWDEDPARRPAAVECCALLDRSWMFITNTTCDVYLSHSSGHHAARLADFVYMFLAQAGHRVIYGFKRGTAAGGTGMDPLLNARATVVCLDRRYQSSKRCMAELKEAVRLTRAAGEATPSRVRPLLVVNCEADAPAAWVSADLRSLLHAPPHTTLSWPSSRETMLRAVEPLLPLLSAASPAALHSPSRDLI